MFVVYYVSHSGPKRRMVQTEKLRSKKEKKMVIMVMSMTKERKKNDKNDRRKMEKNDKVYKTRKKKLRSQYCVFTLAPQLLCLYNIYCTKNIYASPSQELRFLTDPAHVLFTNTLSPLPKHTHTTNTTPNTIPIFVDIFAETIRCTHTGYSVSTVFECCSRTRG